MVYGQSLSLMGIKEPTRKGEDNASDPLIFSTSVVPIGDSNGHMTLLCNLALARQD